MVKFVTNIELSKQLDISIACLNLWRKKGMPFVQKKKGGKVYYDIDEVEKWLRTKE